jgi:DNA modification methylase
MDAMPAESVDAICTDPPYGLEFMGKTWDRLGGAGFHAPKDEGRTFSNASGHMFDNLKSLPRYGSPHQMQAWHQRWAEAAYRVAKPSAYLLAFGGTRTVHRLASALEDAGWIIRDTLVWAYASGFPKSKASLKPAWEPIVMARKPGPLRELAIDACRIGTGDGGDRDGEDSAERRYGERGVGFQPMPGPRGGAAAGRWPSNVVLTDPIFDGGVDGVVGGGEANRWFSAPRRGDGKAVDGTSFQEHAGDGIGYGDTGTYSRFYLIPKADRADREPVIRPEWAEPGKRASSHPTVKPTELMRHLVRLVTPPGGTVLDCFAGSGSTLIAAEQEGFQWLGIEREEEYVRIIEARLRGVQRGLGLPLGDPPQALEPTPLKDPAVHGVHLELFPGMAGPAERDEVA